MTDEQRAKEAKDAKDQALGCAAIIIFCVGGFLWYFISHYFLNGDMSRAADCKNWMIQFYQRKLDDGSVEFAGQMSYWDIKEVTSIRSRPGLMKGTTDYLIFVTIQDGTSKPLVCTLDY